MKNNIFFKSSTFILILILFVLSFGCRSLTKGKVQDVPLKDNKLLTNYLKYWFKSYGYEIESIQEGLTFRQLDLDKVKIQSDDSKNVLFFKKRFLIMTSLHFRDGENGHCFISLNLLKKKYEIGESPFFTDWDCNAPFKRLAKEKKRHFDISTVHSINLKPIKNFKVQRRFRYYVESKRWKIAIKFLEKGADPLIYINKYENVGTTPLNIAFGDFSNFYNRIYSIHFINKLIQKEGVLNFKEASGKSSLVKHLLMGRKLVVTKLIQEGATLLVKNKKEKESFLDILKSYKKEEKSFMKEFYQKLINTSKFPSSISIEKK